MNFPDLPGWIGSYGLLGVVVWLSFEVRDLRRIMRSHLLTHHNRHEKEVDDFIEAK